MRWIRESVVSCPGGTAIATRMAAMISTKDIKIRIIVSRGKRLNRL